MNPYEKFHSSLKLQKRIISKRSLTYRGIIRIIEEYESFYGEKKALDIGCGSGVLSFFLGSLGFKITGIDISKRAIQICIQNKETLGLSEKINFFKLDFPSEIVKGKYDLIICSEVLEHIRDEGMAMKAIRRKLKDDGIAIFSVPSIECPLFRLGLSIKHDKLVGHLRRYSSLSIENLLKNSKLELLKVVEAEGILKNFLFIVKSPFNSLIIRLANRFLLIADIIVFVDNIFLKLFGSSQIIFVAKKYENRD